MFIYYYFFYFFWGGGGKERKKKHISKSCTLAKTENFWRATGQSNLSDIMEDCFNTGQSAVVWTATAADFGQKLKDQIHVANGVFVLPVFFSHN